MTSPFHTTQSVFSPEIARQLALAFDAVHWSLDGADNERQLRAALRALGNLTGHRARLFSVLRGYLFSAYLNSEGYVAREHIGTLQDLARAYLGTSEVR